MPEREPAGPLLSYIWWAVQDIEARRTTIAQGLQALQDGEEAAPGRLVVTREVLATMEESNLAGLLHIQNVLRLIAQEVGAGPEADTEDGGLARLKRAVGTATALPASASPLPGVAPAQRQRARHRLRRVLSELLSEEE